MTARRWSLFAAATLLSLLAAWPALAQAAGAPTRLTMQPVTQLPVIKSDPQATYVVAAQLTDAGNRPLGGQRVTMQMVTDILGQKRAQLATVTTDGGGAAKTIFVATKEGKFEFAAKFEGTEAFAASEAAPIAADIKLLTAAEGAKPEPHGVAEQRLALIGRWVPWAGLGLGVAVWLTLFYVMGSVLIVVPGAARRQANRD